MLRDQVPPLGKPFQEDKDRKADRKRGKQDSLDGMSDFKTDCTYSFSFHSMYIDIAKVLFARFRVFSYIRFMTRGMGVVCSSFVFYVHHIPSLPQFAVCFDHGVPNESPWQVILRLLARSFCLAPRT